MVTTNIISESQQATSTAYFETTTTPITSLLKLLFIKDGQIQFISDNDIQGETVIESKKAKFVNTNKEFTFNIYQNEKDWLVDFRLNSSDTLTEDEIKICSKFLTELNQAGFCFYINNEEDTIDFDSIFHPKLNENKPIKINKKVLIDDQEWILINKKMRELEIPFKIANRIRVQRNNFKKRYGDNYIPYIKEYAENQFKEFMKD